MPRPPTYERARMFVSRMAPAVSGSGGHNATFAVALALLQGFDLPRHEARAILDEYNARCSPAWSDRELEHKLNQADKQQGYPSGGQILPRGCLRDEGGKQHTPGSQQPPPRAAAPAPPKLEFDPDKLARAAGRFAEIVDLVWLANRSACDPALVTPQRFLTGLYKPGEKVLVFTNDKTQGEALWPAETLPTTGPRGVWFLCQPVDGISRPNPRKAARPDGSQPMSRRIEECVTDWRFLVLESDRAALKPWLGALAQLPLRISAIYTSGGRSIHALVRIDAPTKDAWDAEKFAMKAGLVILGADPGAMSAVRLTRLPACYREGKDEKDPDDPSRKVYRRFETPAPQKLLYYNPEAPLRPLVDILARRDVEADWLKLAAAGPGDADPNGGAWITRGLAYYARQSTRLRNALEQYTAAASGV